MSKSNQKGSRFFKIDNYDDPTFTVPVADATDPEIIYMFSPIPRGKIMGRPVGKQPADEAEHFVKCDCGGWVDMRDLGQVLDHVGPLPHPSEDQPQ